MKHANLSELIEAALVVLLKDTPTGMSGKDWAAALAILLENWPQFRDPTLIQRLDHLSDEQHAALVAAVEQVIADAPLTDSSEHNVAV